MIHSIVKLTWIDEDGQQQTAIIEDPELVGKYGKSIAHIEGFGQIDLEEAKMVGLNFLEMQKMKAKALEDPQYRAFRIPKGYRIREITPEDIALPRLLHHDVPCTAPDDYDVLERISG